MKYFVILQDGRRFGPADVATLNQWIAENRLTPDTMLEAEGLSDQIRANTVPGLNFPGAQAAPVMPPSSAPPHNPFDPLSQPQQPVATRPQTGAQGNPYANPPGPATSYPRAGYGFSTGLPEDIRKKFNIGAFAFTWIWGLNHRAPWTLLVILVALLPLGWPIYSIYIGIKGNEAAWNSGRFSTVDEMLDCQKTWGYWGLAKIVLVITVYVSLVALGTFAS